MYDTLYPAAPDLMAALNWLVVPYLSGRYAKSKGYDFWWTFGFAIVLSIIVPLVILGLPRRDPRVRESMWRDDMA